MTSLVAMLATVTVRSAKVTRRRAAHKERSPPPSSTSSPTRSDGRLVRGVKPRMTRQQDSNLRPADQTSLADRGNGRQRTREACNRGLTDATSANVEQLQETTLYAHCTRSASNLSSSCAALLSRRHARHLNDPP